MVSSGAFWVAISYRLAACFTAESEVRVELKFIGDRSTGQKTYIPSFPVLIAISIVLAALSASVAVLVHVLD